MILVFFHSHIIRETKPDGTAGPARYRISMKVPNLFWSPSLYNINA